ncbi:MAG: glycosyltransferase family 4 protein [Candidatus Eisenbacteria bacterium]|nr:glycosyltransferase family 4 protein [Candidatus Eisenbacteria bacterium]
MKPSVLHIITDLRLGGSQSMLLARCRDRAYRHHVLCFAPHTGQGGATIVQPLRDSGVEVHSLGHRRPWQTLRALGSGRLGRELDRVLGHAAPSLLHSTLFHSHLLGDALRRRAGLPHLASKEGTDDWMRAWHRGLEAHTLRRADAVVAVSPAAAAVVRRLGVSGERVTVVPNGVDREAIPWAHHASPMQRPTGDRVLTLLGVGRLEAAKGWPDLIAAAARLRTEGREIAVELVGAGSLETELRAVAASAGLGSSFRIHAPAAPGAAAGTAVSSGARPVVVVPSREEGFGLVALEAMALGAAVVATAVGGLPELIRDEESGLLVPPGRSDLLAAAIARLADDPGLAQRLGAAAQVEAERFGIEAMLGAYRDLYGLLIGSEDR